MALMVILLGIINSPALATPNLSLPVIIRIIQPAQIPDGIGIFVHFDRYSMEDFNKQLEIDGLDAIHWDYNLSLEGYYYQLSDSIGFERNRAIWGIEYLSASASGNSNNTIIKWSLPVMGFYFGGLILSKEEKPKGHFYGRVQAGFYWLLSDKLKVTDRPGYLEVTGQTFGGTIGLGWIKEPLCIEIGYRVLNFTDVDQKGSQGFVDGPPPNGQPVPSGPFPYELEYSGPMIKIGFNTGLIKKN